MVVACLIMQLLPFTLLSPLSILAETLGALYFSHGQLLQHIIFIDIPGSGST